MRTVVTGAAGFIGSNLVDRLLAAGHAVCAFDDFSTGRDRFLAPARDHPRFSLVRGDILDGQTLASAMRGAEVVFHLAANADVRYGTSHPDRDLHQNTLGTFHVLEAMRVTGATRIAFSSTGSVYGEPEIFPTPENAPFPVQTSLYGASKLAGEALIQAYCEGFGFTSHIFRFVSILGDRYSHGHVFDFFTRLREDSRELHVLGDGEQRKSYLHVQDCIDAMFLALERSTDRVNIFNLGTDEFCSVRDSISWITGELQIAPRLVFAGGARGWIGDSPFIFLDCRKMRALGWSPKRSIRDSVVGTLRYLQNNDWLLEARA